MFRDYKFDYCVIGVTPTGQLYIDTVAPGLGVALGGCGYTAKSSDEAGRIAARFYRPQTMVVTPKISTVTDLREGTRVAPHPTTDQIFFNFIGLISLVRICGLNSADLMTVTEGS